MPASSAGKGHDRRPYTPSKWDKGYERIDWSKKDEPGKTVGLQFFGCMGCGKTLMTNETCWQVLRKGEFIGYVCDACKATQIITEPTEHQR